jgi:hypothetical protein
MGSVTEINASSGSWVHTYSTGFGFNDLFDMAFDWQPPLKVI